MWQMLQELRGMQQMKLWESKTWLHDRYVVKKLGIIDMAREAGCSHMTIQRALVKYGILKGR